MPPLRAAVTSALLAACSAAPAPGPKTPAQPCGATAEPSEKVEPAGCPEPAGDVAAEPRTPTKVEASSQGQPTADRRREIFDAVLAAFPEGYRDLAKLSFEHVSERFVPSEVRFLAPAAKMKDVSPEELKERACAAKKALGWQCACESVKVGEPKDYAWAEWPDKRVVPVTVQFLLAC